MTRNWVQPWKHNKTITWKPRPHFWCAETLIREMYEKWTCRSFIHRVRRFKETVLNICNFIGSLVCQVVVNTTVRSCFCKTYTSFYIICTVVVSEKCVKGNIFKLTLWDASSCSLVETDWYFRHFYFSHHLGDDNAPMEISINFHWTTRPNTP
jgi:hypothetical protein